MDATKFGLNAYMKPEDIQASKTWTVVRCDVVEMRYPSSNDVQEKLQLLLDNGSFEKSFTLNKHNVSVMIQLYGSNTDNWIGKQISLSVTPMLVKGEKKDVIEIEGVKSPSPSSAKLSDKELKVKELIEKIQKGEFNANGEVRK